MVPVIVKQRVEQWFGDPALGYNHPVDTRWVEVKDWLELQEPKGLGPRKSSPKASMAKAKVTLNETNKETKTLPKFNDLFFYIEYGMFKYGTWYKEARMTMEGETMTT